MRSTRALLAAGAAALLAGLAPSAATAAERQTVRCVGDGDSCGATVKIGGGVTGKVVTVKLSDSDLQLAHVTAHDAVRNGYRLTRASYREGGSVYRFTLDAKRSNPSRARLSLLFSDQDDPSANAPGRGFGPSVRTQGGWKLMKLILSVGAGMSVEIVGGGDGTSICTREETVTTVVTRGNDEAVQLAYLAKGDGGCAFQLSYSQFKVTIKNPAGQLVGSGRLFYGQRYVNGDYVADCNGHPWVGVACTQRLSLDGMPAIKLSK